MTCLISAGAAILAAIATSFLNDMYNRKTRQRMYRRVSIAYIKAYLAEVNVGVETLKAFLGGKPIVHEMPMKCWDMYRPSEDLMDVILLSSVDKPVANGFSPENLLSDLKNYYSYVCVNVNSHVRSGNALSLSEAKVYSEAAKGIADMLSTTLDNLNAWTPPIWLDK